MVTHPPVVSSSRSLGRMASASLIRAPVPINSAASGSYSVLQESDGVPLK